MSAIRSVTWSFQTWVMATFLKLRSSMLFLTACKILKNKCCHLSKVFFASSIITCNWLTGDNVQESLVISLHFLITEFYVAKTDASRWETKIRLVLLIIKLWFVIITTQTELWSEQFKVFAISKLSDCSWWCCSFIFVEMITCRVTNANDTTIAYLSQIKSLRSQGNLRIFKDGYVYQRTDIII